MIKTYDDKFRNYKHVDIAAIIKRHGYLSTEHDWDTVNIVCKHGHVYADGRYLVASLEAATRDQSRALRRLGEPVMDGDDGELSIKFPPHLLPQVMRILKPRYSRAVRAA